MKICCIGLGGIGSFFVHHIDRLASLEQIDQSSHDFYFYDDDTIETKNLLYQNFEALDVDTEKAVVCQYKYPQFNYDCKRVDKNILESEAFDLIIICADNNEIRRTVYEVSKTKNIPFIDARADGKCIGIYSSDTENYLNTLSNIEEPTSCQNPFQIEIKEIEYGNVIVAAILSQVTLNYIRKNKITNDICINI